MVRVVALLNPYMEHSDGHIELIEDDSALFPDIMTLITCKAPLDQTKLVSFELLWYMGCHPKNADAPEASMGEPSEQSTATPLISQTSIIE